MKILVKKKFELHEKHLDILHDSPVRGACVEKEIYREMYGSYKTKSTAKRIRTSWIKRYQEKGYKISRESTEMRVILYIDSSSKIVLWIKEKIVSEKVIRQEK